MCWLRRVTVGDLCSSCSLLCISNSDWATENEAGRSVSVSGNEEPRWRELSPIQFNCNCNYCLITTNKTPVHSTWGLLRVCAACPTPRLNLSSELRPSWEQHPRYVPHRVHAGYNTSQTAVAVIVTSVRTSNRTTWRYVFITDVSPLYDVHVSCWMRKQGYQQCSPRRVLSRYAGCGVLFLPTVSSYCCCLPALVSCVIRRRSVTL